MSLDLSTWVRANQGNKGKAFTVTYYAKVNKDAEVTNNNKASLEYGNNPSDTTITTPSEAKTNTYPLDINKTIIYYNTHDIKIVKIDEKDWFEIDDETDLKYAIENFNEIE